MSHETDPLAAWPAFADAVRARLDAGRVAFGDRSFSRDPADLAREVQEELLDVAAWSFILSRRLDAIIRALDGAERKP